MLAGQRKKIVGYDGGEAKQMWEESIMVLVLLETIPARGKRNTKKENIREHDLVSIHSKRKTPQIKNPSNPPPPFLPSPWNFPPPPVPSSLSFIVAPPLRFIASVKYRSLTRLDLKRYYVYDKYQNIKPKLITANRQYGLGLAFSCGQSWS
ncbi:hypothetical protein L2E82_20961 [Cichorium intybus]|uniref:Uncharacterized protein n=1 Tax=Cichorium intybus TaxID=13427 RepID=A0ACB9DVP5_CICIN|nr:hypothetical protein L2E82_20961 [Cichorium intybus]